MKLIPWAVAAIIASTAVTPMPASAGAGGAAAATMMLKRHRGPPDLAYAPPGSTGYLSVYAAHRVVNGQLMICDPATALEDMPAGVCATEDGEGMFSRVVAGNFIDAAAFVQRMAAGAEYMGFGVYSNGSLVLFVRSEDKRTDRAP